MMKERMKREKKIPENARLRPFARRGPVDDEGIRPGPRG
jgi:hypothetical protein